MKPDTFAFPDLDRIPVELKNEVIENRRSLNVYRMVMHTPAIAPSFLAFSDALRHKNSMPPALRELTILRVGHRYQAPYEIHHHERLARTAELGEPAIAAAKFGPGDPALTAQERLILVLTDELLDQHGLSTASRDKALTELDASQLADFVMTVGFYQLVCNFLSTFGVKVEA